MGKRRYQDFKAIRNKIDKTKYIWQTRCESDYVFWGGDFNIRKHSEAKHFKAGTKKPQPGQFNDVVKTIVAYPENSFTNLRDDERDLLFGYNLDEQNDRFKELKINFPPSYRH